MTTTATPQASPLKKKTVTAIDGDLAINSFERQLHTSEHRTLASLDDEPLIAEAVSEAYASKNEMPVVRTYVLAEDADVAFVFVANKWYKQRTPHLPLLPNYDTSMSVAMVSFHAPRKYSTMKREPLGSIIKYGGYVPTSIVDALVAEKKRKETKKKRADDEKETEFAARIRLRPLYVARRVQQLMQFRTSNFLYGWRGVLVADGDVDVDVAGFECYMHRAVIESLSLPSLRRVNVPTVHRLVTTDASLPRAVALLAARAYELAKDGSSDKLISEARAFLDTCGGRADTVFQQPAASSDPDRRHSDDDGTAVDALSAALSTASIDDATPAL